MSPKYSIPDRTDPYDKAEGQLKDNLCGRLFPKMHQLIKDHNDHLDQSALKMMFPVGIKTKVDEDSYWEEVERDMVEVKIFRCYVPEGYYYIGDEEKVTLDEEDFLEVYIKWNDYGEEDGHKSVKTKACDVMNLEGGEFKKIFKTFHDFLIAFSEALIEKIDEIESYVDKVDNILSKSEKYKMMQYRYLLNERVCKEVKNVF